MKYRVRFKTQLECCSSGPIAQQPTGGGDATRSKSRRGCRECKSRKVKCDNTYPVCLRCQRRGSVCLTAGPPPPQWQVETPSQHMLTLTPSPTEPWPGAVQPDKRLLHYWLDSSCRMLSLTPGDNPFSYPLVEHLLYTPSLVHAVQSVSAGQKVFYHQSSLHKCLSERGLAIQALRRELRDPEQTRPASLLSVFLLGISASWADEQPRSYGREHLSGARALLRRGLADTGKRADPLMGVILGWYLYWDMAISLVASPDDDDMSGMGTDVYTAFETSESQASLHPLVGFSGKLFCLLASLSRHCQRVARGCCTDPYLEAQYEAQLLAWAPEHVDKALVDASLALRNHGLIMLYETRGRPNGGDSYLPGETDLQCTRALAYETLEAIFDTPLDVPCAQSHVIPLLTAGAQLESSDSLVRVKVVDRYRGLLSVNRLTINLWAIQLLEELWCLRDSGATTSWLQLLKSKDWTLNFA